MIRVSGFQMCCFRKNDSGGSLSGQEGKKLAFQTAVIDSSLFIRLSSISLFKAGI